MPGGSILGRRATFRRTVTALMTPPRPVGSSSTFIQSIKATITHSCLLDHVTFDAGNLVHNFLESPGFRTDIGQFFINGNFFY